MEEGRLHYVRKADILMAHKVLGCLRPEAV